MIFSSDSEIREFSSYCIRARKIAIEEFKHQEGRPPSEFEIQDLLKMVVVPFGILKQQNGNSHPPIQQQQPRPQEQPKNQPQRTVQPEGGWKPEILRILNEFPQNLERKSQSKIKIVREIPRSEWNDVKRAFEKEGWTYDWKEKVFMISEEARA